MIILEDLVFEDVEWCNISNSIDISKDVIVQLTLINMFFSHFSWSDWRSAHRDLQSDRSAGGLHDCRVHDVDQPLCHWNDLPLSSGQSDDTSIQLLASVHIYIYPTI